MSKCYDIFISIIRHQAQSSFQSLTNYWQDRESAGPHPTPALISANCNTTAKAPTYLNSSNSFQWTSLLSTLKFRRWKFLAPFLQRKSVKHEVTLVEVSYCQENSRWDAVDTNWASNQSQWLDEVYLRSFCYGISLLEVSSRKIKVLPRKKKSRGSYHRTPARLHAC